MKNGKCFKHTSNEIQSQKPSETKDRLTTSHKVRKGHIVLPTSAFLAPVRAYS